MTTNMKVLRIGHLLFVGMICNTLDTCVSENTTMTGAGRWGGHGNGSEPATDIFILGLFPMSGRSWSGGVSLLPASQMALDHVNSRQDILPGYRLNLVPINTKCDAGVGIHRMYQELGRPPVKLLVLGAACSPVSEATAQASHHWNLTQISYASVSPSLSDGQRFPRFFRVASPDVMMNPARINMMKNLGWQRVATIHESFEMFSKVTDDLIVRFALHNITLLTSEIFTSDPALQVQNLKKHDARIIVGGFYQNNAYKVFCEAYKIGLYGPRIVWILPGWYNDGWWKIQDAESGCTPDQITTAAQGYIATGIVYLNPKPELTQYGMTAAQWWDAYVKYMGGRVLFGSIFAPQGFDTVFAIAMALNDSINELSTAGNQKRLEDFTYPDTKLANLIMKNVQKVRFYGNKGFIYFDENGDHPGMIKIQRLQDEKLQNVGIYLPEGAGLLEWAQDTPILWEGGVPPADSTTIYTKTVIVPTLIYTIMALLAACGIVTAIGFLSFNIFYRKERLIKMSSPVMNNVMLVGCMITYCTVFCQELDIKGTIAMCRARTIVFMVGFSTSFGALFFKTWRVHRIFTNKLKKTVVRDTQILGLVGFIVIIDVIIVGVREITDPQTLAVVGVYAEVLTAGDVVIEHKVNMCTSTYMVYFYGIVYTTKGLLLIFGAFLAWETRKVTIPALNDSQYIGMCIYNVVILSVVGVIISVILDTQVTLKYALISGFLLFGTTVTQCIIFIPKLINLKDMKSSVSADGGDTSDTVDMTRSTFAARPRLMTSSTPGDQSGLDSSARHLEEELKTTKEQLTSALQELATLQNKTETSN